MSLPDTVFIFVLALIIFGPKKLPEIGRQIGRLVGEFRRASNEFKFQIEEELRQADRTDTPKNSNTIAAPSAAATSAENADLSLTSGDTAYDAQSEFSLSEDMAAGQHPNPDAMQEVVDTSYTPELARKQTNDRLFGESQMPVSLATITAAVGAQARKTAPYVPVAESPAPIAEEGTAPAQQEPRLQDSSAGDAPSASPHSGHPAPSEAEIHHG